MCSPSPWPRLADPDASPQAPSTPTTCLALKPLGSRPAPCGCNFAIFAFRPLCPHKSLPPLAGPHATASTRKGLYRARSGGGSPPHVLRRGAANTYSTRWQHSCDQTLGASKSTTQTPHFNPRGSVGASLGGSGLSLYWPCAVPKLQGHRPTTNPGKTLKQVGLALQKHSVDLRLV